MDVEEEPPDNTLIALATHFAQVQFRLKQIISAEPEQKESLLHDLEEFAFHGCSETMTYDTAASGENASTEAQQIRRTELMEKLRTQLRDLEQCAQLGCEGVRSDNGECVKGEGGNLADKQTVVIEELRRRFNLQFGDLERMSTAEVKAKVSRAVEGMKPRANLIDQLQIQVKDLERYITYLQADPIRTKHHPPPLPSSSSLSPSLPSDQPMTKITKRVTFASDCTGQDLTTPTSQFRPLHTSMVASPARTSPDYDPLLSDLSDSGVQCTVDSTIVDAQRRGEDGNYPSHQNKGQDDLRLTLLVMKKTLSLMQVLTLWQCGGSFHCLPRYVAGGDRKRYHSALQSLEMAVDRVAVLTTALAEHSYDANMAVTMETELHEVVSMTMADSLRVLLEHGLLFDGEAVLGGGGGVGCVGVWGRRWRRRVGGDDCAAWRVFQYYYELKDGKDFSRKPDQLLSSSFSLPIDTSSSMKKTLLTAIYRVENAYRNSQNCSKDTKFRALMCEGFNLCHLAEWFRIVATHPTVADDLYSSSSFLATTGFRPAIAHLESLKDNPPCQPVSLPSDYYHSPNMFHTTN